MVRDRTVGIAVAAALGLGLAVPALAQERGAEEREHRNIMIKRLGTGERDIVIDGKRLSELRAKCESGNKEEADVRSGEGKDSFRTRVIICGDGKLSDSAELRRKVAHALERARAGLRHEELSDDARARAIEALEREIARLRAQGK